jgi:hypothetical protein
MKDIFEHGPQCCDVHGGDSDGWLYHGPFNKVDAFPGVVRSVCKALDINDANDCCGACTTDSKLYSVGGRENTYKNPRDSTRITDIFVRGFMCIFHTKKIGKIPNDQSVMADIAQ